MGIRRFCKIHKQKRHDYLYWEFHEHGGKQAVRKGKWKAIRLGVKKNPDGPLELYNLQTDLYEKNNIASRHQDIVHWMEQIMARRLDLMEIALRMLRII